MSAAPTVISVPRPRASVLRPDFLVGVALAVVTLALYWPVTHFEFISFDDGLYITDNATVQEGLTLDGVKWAFGALHASNWHPVTWLSHMLDCTLHRLNAGGHHFTNVLLHAANTVFLFGLLLGWTGARWRSAVVAGLFAWHPLHVESVAWVAERKDVLSTLFLLATLHAYGRYTVRRAWGWYALALVWFALGLMSKAMLVTLPCLLLLLDYWPLRRWRFGAARDGEEPPGPPVRLRTILLEKIPFFLLTLGVCVVTVVAQKSSGALKPLASMPVTDRLSNTVTAYAGYLWKTIWPEDLAIFYPLPGSWAAGTLAMSCAVMAGVTALAWWWRARRPWLAVGWLWYVGTLVPVIGLVQVGWQAMADRYTYVPLIGVFVAVVWGAAEWAARRRLSASVVVAAGGALLFSCALGTHAQLQPWRSSALLFGRAVEVTRGNYLAHLVLGVALKEMGLRAEAVAHYHESARLNPRFGLAYFNLAVNMVEMGDLAQATNYFAEFARLRYDTADKQNAFGATLAKHGQVAEAVAHFRAATESEPDYARAHYNLGRALNDTGQPAQAVASLRAALRLQARWPAARQILAWILATTEEAKLRDGAAALRLAEEACEQAGPPDPLYLDTLAAALAACGRFDEAGRTAAQAVELAVATGQKDLAGQINARHQSYEKGQPWRQPHGAAAPTTSEAPRRGR